MALVGRSPVTPDTKLLYNWPASHLIQSRSTPRSSDSMIRRSGWTLCRRGNQSPHLCDVYSIRQQVLDQAMPLSLDGANG